IGNGQNYYSWGDPCFYAEHPDDVDQIYCEAEAAIAALSEQEKPEASVAQAAQGVTEAACMDCGLAYGDDRFPDLVVPSDTWQIIAPDDGLLCPNCLCGRAAKLGIECQATFRSGPFNAQTPPEGAVTE